MLRIQRSSKSTGGFQDQNLKFQKKNSSILVQIRKKSVLDNHLILQKYKAPIPNEVRFIHKVVLQNDV
jgi:hypothetical protein